MMTYENFFKGKLINIKLSDDNLKLEIGVVIPKNYYEYAVGEAELFEEVSLMVAFDSLVTGRRHRENDEIVLENSSIIFALFKNRAFRNDSGEPNMHNVDDVNYKTPISVLEDDNQIKFILNSKGNITPYLSFDITKVEILNLSQEVQDFNEVKNNLNHYYSNQMMSATEQMQWEWKEFYNITNSPAYYRNKLSNWHGFNLDKNKEFQNINLPCWVEIGNIRKYEEMFTEILEFDMIKATTRKSELNNYDIQNVIWLAPVSYAATLIFLFNELINSSSLNPFEEVLKLYISKWEKESFINNSFINDLEKMIESDRYLKSHSGKKLFLNQTKVYMKLNKHILV